MDPLAHTRDQSRNRGRTAASELAPKKAISDTHIGRKGDGHRFLGFSKCDFRQLYPGKGKTATGLYYTELLDAFDTELWKKKRPHLVNKTVLFHHDNASAHSCAVTAAKLVELGYEVVPHPACSSDRAPQ
ncbi:hypothetical protein MRX96_002060 [Rhipicephalus microplus]